MSAKRQLCLLWRISAFVVLVGWVTALGICSAHCALGRSGHIGERSAESLPPCHGGPVSPDSNSNSDSQSQTASSFCFTVKSLSFHVDPVFVNAPSALAFIEPALASLSVLESATLSAKFFCQGRPPDFVFTPEVYLGPAFRSHAPPRA